MIETKTPRRLVRLHLDHGSEVAWAEHVDGNLYRVLNTTMSAVELKLTDPNMDLPEGHPREAGKMVRVHCGHLIEATPVYPGNANVISAQYIVGFDDKTPTGG
jgi:hypothetical protein